MRALTVLSPSIEKKVEESQKYYIDIDSHKIPLALIHIPDTEFDETNDNYDNLVLIKKEGFSLNYRDLGIIQTAWHKLSKQNVDSYYPIGSDFCGRVVKKGKNVKDLSIGDRVIGDGTYPFVAKGITPGVPTNHSSKELELLHYKKLKKIPDTILPEVASGMSIGTQTTISMIEKAEISEGANVLVTSVTSNTSLFFLGFLKHKNCNVYGLSYSGEKLDEVKKEYPFIKDIFSFKDNAIPKNLLFDAILDPFIDTYLESLVSHLNFNAKYVTCGIYNQSMDKFNSKSSYKNVSNIMGALLSKNASIIGNCLGNEQNLIDGIELLGTKKATLPIDSVFNEESFKEFIDKSFGPNRFGKTVMLY